VVGNNDGFHFISCEHVHLSDSSVACEDDACAMFGSCKWMMVTNCSFSTRWSVFRFGGGTAENITVSNCLIFQTYGCPIKMHGEKGSYFSNISFSNLVMNGVTGPISISLGKFSTGPGEQPEYARNISFSNIHAVVSRPEQLPDGYPQKSNNPAEIFSCISINGAGDAVIENISFNDLHVTYPGGGTAKMGAVRDVPPGLGEYYSIGIPPAYALYARNVKGLTMQDVRFEFQNADQRPAMIFDHVEDASVNGFGAQGDPGAESLLRFIDSKDVLLTAARALTPTPVFLQVEGAGTKNLIIDGGDLSKASESLAFADNAPKSAVKLRD